MHIEFIDVSPLPMINTDLEVGGAFPQPVEEFRYKISQADCFLFASPEYNYSVTRKDPPFSRISSFVIVPANSCCGVIELG